MTRKLPWPVTLKPGKSWLVKATMICSSVTKRWTPVCADIRQFDEPLDLARHAHERAHAAIVAQMRELQGDGEAEIGNEGKRMRGIDRERRQNRENMKQEIIFEPFALDADNSATSTMTMPALAISLRNWRQRSCCEATSWPTRSPRRINCSAGESPSSEGVVSPECTWPTRPATRTMKNSSRLLAEIDRKRNCSSKRMVAVGRLLQHAPVEFEPGEFAIDETGRAWRKYRLPRRRLAAVSTIAFVCG